ncbi:ABC transporter substrate-binding protein [Roseomonas sp. GC11]|uniref:ABC transporter substrate-binding protein n=1 Tax=Roseomonas sp. GC11 TaxID=2950546 RepID=UPI0021088814|nr:ABC transporter substrate-binding protein [Roseomonas sp. GC11]
MVIHPGRRGLLANVLTGVLAGLGPGCPAEARPTGLVTGGIIPLGWPAAQALLALGLPCPAVTEAALYRRAVIEPALPAGVLELGRRAEPNMELLRALAPAALVVEPSAAGLRERLRRIAPVLPYALAGPQGMGLAEAEAGLSALAEALGQPQAALDCRAALHEALAAARARLRPLAGQPVFLVHEILPQHVLLLGRNSLFHAVLAEMGLENAWSGPSSVFGHAIAPLEALLAVPQARVVVTGMPERLWPSLREDPVLSRLPPFAPGRLVLLPPTLFYGGVPAALRLTRLLTGSLSPHA